MSGASSQEPPPLARPEIKSGWFALPPYKLSESDVIVEANRRMRADPMQLSAFTLQRFGQAEDPIFRKYGREDGPLEGQMAHERWALCAAARAFARDGGALSMR